MTGHRWNTTRLSIGITVSSLFLVSLLLILIPAIPKSYAHAFIVKSDPSSSQSLTSPPSKVDVYFSDPIDIRYSQLKVLDSSGKQVDNKDVKTINGDQTTLTVSLPSEPKNGIYTVSTKVLDATDGHVTENAFVFGVGQAVTINQLGSSSPQLQIPEAAARFPALVGQVLVVGAAFSSLWLWRPISKIDWLNANILQARAHIDAKMVKLMVIGSVILLASGFGMIFVQANAINAGIGDAILTKFGNVWIVRMVQSAILFAISIGIYNRMRKGKGVAAEDNNQQSSFILHKGETAALLVIGLAVLATTTLISHGAATGQSLSVSLDFVHNVVASLWIGGVIYLAFLVVPELKRMVARAPRPISGIHAIAASTLSILIPRFSIIVLTLLGIIIITGPFLLYTIEPNLDLTISSLYGKALIAKLVLAGSMAAIGGYNQRVVHRQALRATVMAVEPGGGSVEEEKSQNHSNYDNDTRGRGGKDNYTSRNKNGGHENDGGARSALYKFGKSAKIEAGLGIGLLVAVAVLVNTGTPSSEFQIQLQQQQAQATQTNPTISLADQPFKETRFVENNASVVLQIDPFIPSSNNFTISFLDQNRNPIDMNSVQMRFTQIEKNIGPITVDLKSVSKGVFSANAAFGLPGHWNLRVEGVQNKQNATNLVATYGDLFVKPRPSQLTINIQEFKVPDNESLPLYPVYDNSRNVIWIGDTKINSARIWEFNLNSSNFIEHKLKGVSIVTIATLYFNNKIWFLDPIGGNLGVYDPTTDMDQLFKLPNNEVPSGIAADNQNGSIWVTITTTNDILRFDTKANKFTNDLKLPGLPGQQPQPFSIAVDKTSGQIWVLDEGGKLANIDPSKNYNITEYSPRGGATLAIPTALLIDPDTGNIFISEHEGHAVSVFNPLLKTFTKYSLDQDQNALPYGLAMDSSHFLWVAQHLLNKVAVVDPRTGAFTEAEIPLGATQTQWITSDSQGNIWLAEQRAAAIGFATTSASSASPNGNNNSGNQTTGSGIFKLGVGFADVVGPSVAAGIAATAVLFSKSMINLGESIRHVMRNGSSHRQV